MRPHNGTVGVLLTFRPSGPAVRVVSRLVPDAVAVRVGEVLRGLLAAAKRAGRPTFGSEEGARKLTTYVCPRTRENAPWS